jgi:predicted small metal-binding protein
MKELDCPMDGCHAHIEAETADEIMQQAAAHASEAHPDLELDEATVERIQSKIRDIPAGR